MDSPKKQASKILRDKKMYQRWLAIFMCLALVVTSGTVTALKLTGQAMTAKQLQCSYVPHEHTDECYNDEGELICGLSDKVVHTHDSSCYDAEGALVCPLEELEPHEHDDSCYTEVKELICGQQEHEAIPAHHHTEECYTTETADEQVLTCGLEETDGVPAVEAAPGHVHTDACYTTETVEVTPAGVDEEGNEIPAVTEEQRTLTCGMAEGEGAVEGQPEIPAHHHTEECYTTQTVETKVLSCGLEENGEEIPAHHHTDACYKVTRELTCGKEEAILHIHDDDCYDIEYDEETGEEISRTLTCDMLQLEAHQHGDGCFVEVPVDEIIPAEKPEEELPVAAVVYCGKQEHTHTDACYQQDENGEFVLDENGEKILTCELEEHTHTEECFVEPELVMLTATKTVGDVTVTVEYSEDANIPEGAELDFYEYAKDSEEYALYAQQVEGEIDRAFNIGFYLNGEEVEPAEGAIIKVNITYPGMEEKQQGVTHITDEGPVDLGAQTTTDGESTTLEFYTDSFSPFVTTYAAGDDNVIVLKVGESITLSGDDHWDTKNERWTPTTSDIVSINPYDSSCTVTGIQASTTPVTITYQCEYRNFASAHWHPESKTFKVYVVEKLEITGNNQVREGNDLGLTLTGAPEGVDVKWECSSPNVTLTNASNTGVTVHGNTASRDVVTITAYYTLGGSEPVPARHNVTVKPRGNSSVVAGQINADKYIVDKYQDGTYELNLDFSASKGYGKTQLDVVFVVDISGSMKDAFNGAEDGSCAKEKAAYKAVKDAVDYLETKQSTLDAQYAIVRFSTGYSVGDWKSVTIDPEAKNGTGFGHSGATNYEAGLLGAYQLLESESARPNAEKAIIFISDGEATCRYTKIPGNSVTPNEIDTSAVAGERSAESYKIAVGGSWLTGYKYKEYPDGVNMTAGQNVVKAIETAGYVDYFYAVGVGNNYGDLSNLIKQPDVLSNDVIAGTYDGGSETALNNALNSIIKEVADVFCSQVVATDNLQPYVQLVQPVSAGDPSALTVSILNKDGKLVEGITGNGSASEVTFTAKDKEGKDISVKFVASHENGVITGTFKPKSYNLNTEYTYRITAHIQLDESQKGSYITGRGSAIHGAFTELPNGVYTNKGDGQDLVTGKFETEDAEMPFPQPVVPQARELTITKVDADKTNTKLTGAVFTLTQDGKQVGETVTTDKDGKATIKGIRTGTYILAETKAPDGYTTPDEKDTLRITVNEDGSVSFAPTLAESKVWSRTTLSAAAKDPATMTVKNESAGVPVEIIKKGVKGVDLKGIDFTIGEENRQISEGVANPESGVIIYGDQNENLPIGITEITEILPTGSQYQTIKPVYVEVEKDDNATATGGYEVTIVADVKGTPLTEEQSKACAATAAYDQTKGKWVVTIQNTLAPITGVEIFKTTYGATGDNAGLSDAKFDLYVAPNGEDYSTELTRVASDLTTGKNGKIAITSAGFAGFEADKTYYLVETKAPAGYVAGGEPIKITVKVNGEGVAEINATTKTNNNGDTVKVTGKTITVYNSAGVELPHTGGIGTQLFTVGGGLLMVLAAGLYFWNKRRISEM